MADFIKLPVVETTAVNTQVNGKPFTDSAYKISTGTYAGTDNGDVYISRVNNIIYFTSIGYGYFGFLWVSDTNFTSKWEVKKTDWSSIYTTRAVSVVGTWVADLTVFETESEMLERFYDTIVFPDVSPLSGDITVLLTPKAGSSTIIVDIPIAIEGADTIIVSAEPDTIDPNNSGGNSGQSAPTGTFDDTSDPIPIPTLPIISAANTGLISLFRPTQVGMANLGRYLWTHLNDFWENLQKLFTNPMDYFIAFNIFPVNPEVGREREIYIGNWGTSITMPPVLSQWYDFNCGTVLLENYWGSALDYSPNTKVQLMLPFIGSVNLNTDEVMGNTIGVKYHIDLLSGSCVALVTVNDSVYYQFTGECAVSVPLTGADWSRVYSAVVGAVGTAIAGGVGVSAATAANGTGGLVAAKSYEAAASAGASYAAINQTSKGIKGVAEMRKTMLEAAHASMDNAKQAASRTVRRSEGVRNMRLANTINNTVQQVVSSKLIHSHSGTISGAAGMLGVRTPYLIVEYPNQSLAENYKHFVGYPSNMYARLGTLSGYTEVEQVIPEGIWGTDDELAELVESLKGGVYL